MVVRMPLVISEPLMRYCLAPQRSPSYCQGKQPSEAMREGGVMIPPSIARQCWKPIIAARTMGSFSYRPRNMGALRTLPGSGRVGVQSHL